MANSYPPPVWLPDWKDPAAYKHVFTRDQLAWEFLRRNPDYQADLRLYESLPYHWPEGGKTPKSSGRSLQPWAPMVYYYATPPGLPGETLEEYELRLEGTDYAVTNLESGLCEKWGIGLLCVPETSPNSLHPFEDPFPIVGRDEDAYVIDSDHGRTQFKTVPNGYLFGKYSTPRRAIVSIFKTDPAEIAERDKPPNVVPIWFSLDHSLKAQLDSALIELKARRDELEAKREYRAAPSVATLVKALRVHDARLAGATHEEIQNALDARSGVNRDGITRATDRDLKLARQMIAGGYRDLIGME